MSLSIKKAMLSQYYEQIKEERIMNYLYDDNDMLLKDDMVSFLFFGSNKITKNLLEKGFDLQKKLTQNLPKTLVGLI